MSELTTPESPKLYAGVDGGGSKTLAVIVNERGEELGRARAGASNYQGVGLDRALTHVREALQGALAAAGAGSNELPVSLVLGLAGVDRPDDISRWQTVLTDELPLAQNVEISNDAELVLFALPERQGLGLIAGTGSIALARDGRGQRVRAGGWGHFMGDEGSGFWLARSALNAATRAADGRGPKTLLLDLILQEWNLREPSDMIGAVYGSSETGIDNTKIAGLAQLVFKAAEQEDDLAQILIKDAVNELALAVKACDTRLFFDRPPGLAVAGGLLLNYPGFLKSLTKRLEAMMTIGPVIRVDDPGLVAARAAISVK